MTPGLSFQHNYIDSLEKQLETVNDTLKIEIYNKLSRLHREISLNNSMNYAKEALKIAEAMNLNNTQGILIISVIDGSPAKKAGLRGGTQTITIDDGQVNIGGDVIVKIDLKKVNTFEDIVAYTEENKSPSDTVSLTIIRKGDKMTLNLILGERSPL